MSDLYLIYGHLDGFQFYTVMKMLTYISLQVYRIASFEQILRYVLLSPVCLIIYSGIFIEINVNLSSLEVCFLKNLYSILFENQVIFLLSVFWHFLHSL